jgi:hypothetical protein
MQVRILPAAPLPDGVKVARRFVKPHGAGASPALAANLKELGISDCGFRIAEWKIRALGFQIRNLFGWLAEQ